MNDLLRLIASEGMIGTNNWLALANGFRMDDRDKWMISFGWWHSKGLAGVSERLTLTNDALRGWPDLRLWLIVRIGASICTASCVYQEHEGTTNVTLQTWDNVNASLNCQTVFLLLLLLLSNYILVNVLYCSRDVTPTRCLGNPKHGDLLLQGIM
jgi:hypothetical protein